MNYPDSMFSSTSLNTVQSETDTTLSTSHFIRAFKRWWVLVLLLALLGATGASTFGYVRNRHQYQSTVQMLLGFSKSDSYSTGDIQTNTQLLGTFSDLITSDAVLTPVAAKANTSIANIRRSVSVTSSSSSLIITIQLTRNSASEASSSVREISSQSQHYINRHFPQTQVTILTPQITATHPSTNYTRYILFGTVGGLIIGFLLCLILPEKRRNASHSLHVAASRK